jgi:hypothetical protein
VPNHNLLQCVQAMFALKQSIGVSQEKLEICETYLDFSTKLLQNGQFRYLVG